MKQENNILDKKRIQLKSKKQQNLRNIEQIKQLRQSIQALKWKIPQIGVQDEIQQLKQSIKIPNLITKQQDKQLQSIIEQQQKQVLKQTDSKWIKYLQQRKQMLLKLDKLKIDGNLYQSHRRVILKQYLEQVRQNNLKFKQNNKKLEEKHVDLEGIKKKYEDLLKQLNLSAAKLSASRLL